MRPLRFALPLLAALLFTACVYRPDIKQGNFLSDALIGQLKPGMTPAQVEFLMGPPMIQDPFHPGRWDYVYYNNPADRSGIAERHVVLHFKDGKLASIERRPPAKPAS